MPSPAMIKLLTLIRSGEAPKGYGQISSVAWVFEGKRRVRPAIDCTKLTVDEVLKLQDRMLAAGSKSTACAGYQFLKRTLKTLKKDMNLSGGEKMTPELQDAMAIRLMVGRGLNRYLAWTMTQEAFANALAMEWASLPVVTPRKGFTRMVRPGQSYYYGDGINAALHKPHVIIAAVRELRT